MRLSLRLYRLLLKLYPAGFRENYGSPLERQFRDDLADVRGPRDLMRFWAGTVLDVGRSLPAQLGREIAQDSRHTLRLWRRSPFHTAMTVAVLAIAIGANTGVFSVLNALLLRSLPFEQPERLALLKNYGPPRQTFHEWRQQSSYLADAATYDTVEVNVEGVEQAARMRLTETSSNFFAMLGKGPADGRGFLTGEDIAGRNAVAVIGHGLWRRLFGADLRAIGSTIRVNGATLTVVGIAPPGFDFPQKTDLWAPTTFDYERIPKTGSVIMWTTIGRLAPALTWPEARRAFESEADQRSPGRQREDLVNRPALIPLQEQLAGPVRDASLILMAGVGLLLLLACANIANLLLARTIARSSELSVRTALGASRARLTQQLLTETVLLSIVATAAGLLVAHWTAGIATAVQPASLASQSYTILDWRVLAFSAALSILTGLVFGVGPALYASRNQPPSASRTATPAVRHMRTRRALIAAQIAVTVVLLTGSIALGRSFMALMRVDNGYQIRSMVTLSVSLAGGLQQGTRAWPYLHDVLSRVRDVPEVVSVSGTESLPLNIDAFMGGKFQIDNRGSAPIATVVHVAPGFFSTIGAGLIAGREFSTADLSSGERVAIINDELARTYGDADLSSVIGRTLTAPRMSSMRIVGVVRTLRFSAAGEAHPQVYRPSLAPLAMTIVAHVRGEAGDRVAAIRDAVQSVDPKVPVFNIKTMEERLDIELARPRFYTLTVLFFGGLGLLLAVMGVYGVVSYSMLQRTREMGIRLALGTTPTLLRATMLWQTLSSVGTGAMAGVIMALAFGRFLQSLVRGADGATVPGSAVAVLITAGVSAAAIWAATRHVARLEISDVLRAELAD
jgi:putative ABC transport system permease protein